jgi:hypothetical protein
MQVNPAELAAAAAAPTGGVAVARVLAGNLAAVPVGDLLQAVVTRVTPGAADVTVNGQPLTIRPGAGLQPGVVMLVRVPPGANTNPPTLELLGRVPNTPQGTPPQAGQPAVLPNATGLAAQAQQAAAGLAARLPTTTPSPQPAAVPVPAQPPKLAVVDVVSASDGRFRVQIDGRTEVATSSEPLVPGGRYVMQVEQTPAGLALRAAPDTPSLPTDVASAILRAARPADLGASVKPLLAELAALPPNTAAPVQQAAAVVREALQALLPEGRPQNPAELQNLVANGGLHYEAKLARQVADDGSTSVPAKVSDTAKPSPPAADKPASDIGLSSSPDRATTERPISASPDLKEGLLRLFQAAQDLGTAAQFPAAKAALDGIESQQAANVYAQAQGTPFVLQVPFPDRSEWRTLNLAVEPDRTARSDDRGPSDNFRMLMHVPLSDLGETWIDAGLSGNRFRAVVYLDSPTARDRVRAELPGLRDELLGDGFGEVLLDVRPSDALPSRQRKQAAAMRAGRPENVTVLDVRA